MNLKTFKSFILVQILHFGQQTELESHTKIVVESLTESGPSTLKEFDYQSLNQLLSKDS